MPVSFDHTHKVIGLKQSRRAVKEGRVLSVYVAQDAETGVVEPFLQVCREENIPITPVPTMKELGTAAGIQIGAAVVALLK